jgi:hypothetical protein
MFHLSQKSIFLVRLEMEVKIDENPRVVLVQQKYF